MRIVVALVFLGVLGTQIIPGLKGQEADGILLRMLSQYAPLWLAGILGAGIISAVMGSDCHQVLALSTMFTKDIYQHYGGRHRYGLAAIVDLEKYAIRDASPKVRSQAIAGGGRAAVQSGRRSRARMG